ncbi:glycosyl hydrolase family 65 protein [Geodermatophilus aquaeductus]|uniref:Trehalose and maltose hydrolase (Possible phosphorylase) n=1 Tax=Geodermatophilus aquaeductus TaxID=1564161 RepID=A0A521FV27_9ACTN|nr:glycosyl hydrolase family 65 protein [Geodermatophilus aquaeductus]SMP00038.1 Trehalose and maltose hydrolase (possible phosphorylase) [Geodermatophilus aquaeductus]
MTGWLLRYEGLDPAQEPLREALCTLGNGRFATRGAAPESRAGGCHYPGTYAAGVFNRLTDEVDGRRVENESMVNLPDWQSLTLRIAEGPDLGPETGTVSAYVQELDLRRGVLTRRYRVTDAQGRTTRIAQRRLVSMADPFLAALDTTVVAENWEGRIVVRSGLDGRVENTGVARYRHLSGRHLRPGEAAVGDDGVVQVTAETCTSRIRIGLAARHRVLVDGRPCDVPVVPLVEGDTYAGTEVALDVVPDRAVTVEKVVALCTSRDRAIDEPGAAAGDELVRAPWFDGALARHEFAWRRLWDRCDVEIDGRVRPSLILRLHVFHLLQTVSPHSIDLDVGIPARGLHGEAYRGHVFWDELFVLPFLSLRLPEVARAMLLYRWRRLPQARAAARAAGRRGAMFPWQSGSTGREESQLLHLNPRSGHWLPDNSALQRHIGLAVAFNTWRYYEATGDIAFLDVHGAEMLLEVAAFFADLATYDRSDDRYDICGVMGPDEYHDALPWRDRPGLDDNAYTNVMTAWTLARAQDCLDLLGPRRQAELLDQLGLGRPDLERWEHVSRKLRLCWHDDGVLSQFRGYDRLEEFDWDGYRRRYGDISRLDRILEAQGDSTNGYKLSKQADAVMVFQLLTADEFYAVLDRLGYPHDRQTIPRTIRYYVDRTCHGSTLSKVVHAWVLARGNRRRAWDYWLEALESDIADTQGGTTGEGIHLGAMAGTVDLLQRAFTGLETRGDALGLDPYLPDALASMRFRLRYRDHPEVEVAITHHEVVVGGNPGQAAVLPLRVRDVTYQLDPRSSLRVPLSRKRNSRDR